MLWQKTSLWIGNIPVKRKRKAKSPELKTNLFFSGTGFVQNPTDFKFIDRVGHGDTPERYIGRGRIELQDQIIPNIQGAVRPRCVTRLRTP